MRIEAEYIHSGQSTLGRRFDQHRSVADEERVLLHDEGPDVSGSHVRQSLLELGRSANFGEMKCEAQAAGGGGHLGKLSFVNLVARIGQVAHPSETRDRLLEYFQTLGHEFPVDCREPREVPPWPRQTIREPDHDRLTHRGEDHGE